MSLARICILAALFGCTMAAVENYNVLVRNNSAKCRVLDFKHFSLIDMCAKQNSTYLKSKMTAKFLIPFIHSSYPNEAMPTTGRDVILKNLSLHFTRSLIGQSGQGVCEMKILSSSL